MPDTPPFLDVGALSRPHLLLCRFRDLYVQVMVQDRNSLCDSVIWRPLGCYVFFVAMLYQYNASDRSSLDHKMASLYDSILWQHKKHTEISVRCSNPLQTSRASLHISLHISRWVARQMNLSCRVVKGTIGRYGQRHDAVTAAKWKID